MLELKFAQLTHIIRAHHFLHLQFQAFIPKGKIQLQNVPSSVL